jgi:hypothetical protein
MGREKMPLAFHSLSHGTVAFGFFNIETDMLLLERVFFFADRFCRAVVELAWAVDQAGDSASGDVGQATFGGWQIEQPAALGNLHGAIAGADLSGFIGATYRRFPFPAHPDGFKQSPHGGQRQSEVTEMIECYGRRERFTLTCGAGGRSVRLGDYEFDRHAFTELVDYVEHGGYPRYRKEARPDCVRVMMTELRELSAPWLAPAASRSASSPSGDELVLGSDLEDSA